MMDFSAIAFIPARKGSKRLPYKNKKLLNGKPLFQYTAEAAVNSKCYKQVLLTTDDEEIMDIGKGIKGVMVLERPRQYAGDEVRAKDVVLYHLKQIGTKADYVSLLMPTSPFRNAGDIKKSFELLIKENGDSIVSVVRYEFHPALALKIKSNALYSYFNPEKEVNAVRESVFDEACHLNGAIYTARMDFFLNNIVFLHRGTIPYVMDPIKSLDIDDIVDFKIAELLIKGKLV